MALGERKACTIHCMSMGECKTCMSLGERKACTVMSLGECMTGMNVTGRALSMYWYEYVTANKLRTQAVRSNEHLQNLGQVHVYADI